MWGAILDKRTGNLNDGYRLEIGNFGNPRFLNFEINTTDGLFSIQTNNVIPDVVWQHVVSTYDGSTIKIYVNGVEVGTKLAPLATLFR